MHRSILLGLAALVVGTQVHAAFTAYNDFEPNTGESANLTTYGLGGSGALKDFTTGAAVPATMTVNYRGAVAAGGGSGSEPAAGTDAAAIFGGKVPLAGTVIWYGTDTTWWVDVVFSNLDPATTYRAATTLNRGSTYSNRWSEVSIQGADASTYASSTAAPKLSETTTAINSYNTNNGYVAQWTDINPGADGSFTLHFTHPASTSLSIPPYPVGATQDGIKAYGPGAVMLEAVPEPATLSLLGLAALFMGRRRSI